MHRHPRKRRNARALLVEPPEPRRPLASDFTNPVNALDVNADEYVSPIDILVIFNKLNRDGAGKLPELDGGSPTAYYDVNGNGHVEPNDVLRIINRLTDGATIGRAYLQPPAFGVQGQAVSLTFATDLSEEVDYAIDWDGNGSVDETVRASGEGVTVAHTFPASGEQRVRVTAQANRQGVIYAASAATDVLIDVVEMQDGNLVVGGTVSDDTIEFTSDDEGRINVQVNGVSFGSFAVAGSIIAHGQAGDDVIEASGVRRPAEFHGGAGRDLLLGGDEANMLHGDEDDDILVGGFGDDVLLGSAGRDVLIGGRDKDSSEGGADEDILVAGPTSHDADRSALREISSAWSSPLEQDDRRSELRRRLNAATVFNDATRDLLRGQDGDDWFFGDVEEASDRQSHEPLSVEASLINTAITTDPGVQQMPSVAVNPHDPKHAVIACMDYSLATADAGLPGEGYAGIGVALSRDGGVTWRYSAIPLPMPFDQGAANPIAKFDDQVPRKDLDWGPSCSIRAEMRSPAANGCGWGRHREQYSPCMSSASPPRMARPGLGHSHRSSTCYHRSSPFPPRHFCQGSRDSPGVPPPVFC